MKNIADESTQSVELREKIDLGTKTIEKESYRERERALKRAQTPSATQSLRGPPKSSSNR